MEDTVITSESENVSSIIGVWNKSLHLNRLSAVIEAIIKRAGVSVYYGNPETDDLGTDISSDYSSTINPRAHNLYFDDNKHRIDFILAWDANTSNKLDIASQARKVFESNLLDEGLLLEYDIIHAPFEVLSRYADIFKLRMPIKESQLPIMARLRMGDTKHWLIQKFCAPFQYDETKFSPISRSYTSPYSCNKEYLFEMPRKRDQFFSNATRSWIVDYILRRKYFADVNTNNYAFGINKMLSDKYYSAAYPLHEGRWQSDSPENSLKILYDCWACWKNFYKFQPIDHIRLYFGETIALYFAWLGFYTSMLIPAMIVGLIVFIYGLNIMFSNTENEELCDKNNNIVMCPLCDVHCYYWNISDTCLFAKVRRVFDNTGTVLFAIFMSLWGTFFLEFWKRSQATMQYKWDLTTFMEEEQPPRPEYLSKLENRQHTRINLITGLKEPYLPFWQRQFPKYLFSYSVIMLLGSVLLFVSHAELLEKKLNCLTAKLKNLEKQAMAGLYAAMALAVMLSLIANKIAIVTTLTVVLKPILRESTSDFLNTNVSLLITVIAAVINLIIIFILNYFYTFLALYLTDWECLRTQSEYDNSITFKLFVLQFINYFSAIFYIAFIKGQFTGRPGEHITLFGNMQEECDSAGCLIELCLQLGITMVGKQLIQDNLKELIIPYIVKFIKTKRSRRYTVEEVVRAPWSEDYFLKCARSMPLFYEYLEMVIQFGFLTIFCAAFPLGPFFAFLNNVMEIRVDATKFTTQMRRPVAVKSNSIGIWYSVLYAISRMAIITNAFIIVTTSEFIPRFMYISQYSKDGTLNGYVNFTLSYFNTSDYMPNEMNRDFSPGVEICRYKAFRNPPWSDEPYEMSVEFWHILTARLAFVCIFENVVVVVTSLLSWFIPDVPKGAERDSHIL